MSIYIKPEQIEAWVAKHFDYKRRKGGNELVICNPFNGDTKFKFNISAKLKKSKKSGKKGYWVHDWRPGCQEYNMSFLRFVQKFEDISYKEAGKRVSGQKVNFRYQKPKETFKVEYEEKLRLPSGAIHISSDKIPTAQKLAINYLQSREISYELAKSLEIHYLPNKIIFPYLEYDSIVYWQSRSIIGKQFEFPNSETTGKFKSDFIYGFDNAEPQEPIYITEAIFCSINVGPGGIATGGATIQQAQLRKIRAIGPEYVVLCPDNDEAGLSSIYSNFKLLKPYYELYYCIPPKETGKDWNDLAKQRGNKSVITYIYKEMKPLNLKTAIKFRVKKRDLNSPKH